MPGLPAGQTTAPLRRFGLPVFAAVRPTIPARPTVTVTGAVRHPTQLEVADLLTAGERVDGVADLHCVDRLNRHRPALVGGCGSPPCTR